MTSSAFEGGFDSVLLRTAAAASSARLHRAFGIHTAMPLELRSLQRPMFGTVCVWGIAASHMSQSQSQWVVSEWCGVTGTNVVTWDEKLTFLLAVFDKETAVEGLEAIIRGWWGYITEVQLCKCFCVSFPAHRMNFFDKLIHLQNQKNNQNITYSNISNSSFPFLHSLFFIDSLSLLHPSSSCWL